MRNCCGQAGRAVALMLRVAPHIMLVVESKATRERPLPVPAGGRAFEAQRPRGQGAGGGVAALVRTSLLAQQWRSEPEDGVLWVTVHGALPDSRTLALVVCYHRPP